MDELRQSTAVTVPWGPFVDELDGKTPETGLTIQKAHVRVKKNGGDMAAASADQGSSDAGAPHDEIAVYDGSFNTTDTNTLGRLRVDIQKAGAAPFWKEYLVITAAEWDAKYSTGVRTADVTKWNGTAVATPDTAGYPKTTVKVGTGTGELSLASGVIKATLEQILGTALTEGAAGRLAAAFQTLFNVASPVLTAASVNQTGDSFARLGANGAGLTSLASAADLATLTAAVAVIDDFLDTEIATIKAKTDNLPTDPADQSAVESAITTAQAAILSKLLKYVQLMVRKDTAIGTDNATEKTAINADGGSGAGAFNQATDALEAAADRMALDSTVAKDATVAKATDLATLQTTANDIYSKVDTEIASIISSLSTIAGLLDTEIAAILADTNELQTDWVNGGRLDLLVDAIKAVTDLLPNAGALTSLAQDSTVAKEATLTTTGRSDPAALGAALGGSLSPLAKLDWILASIMRAGSFNKTTGVQLIKNSSGTDIAKATAADDGTTTSRGAYGAP